LPKGESKTPSFVCEIPLRVVQKQEKKLNARFEASRQFYNAMLGEGLRRMKLMRESKAYQAARKIPKDEAHQEERRATFSALRVEYGFTEYQLSQYGTQVRHSWIGEHIGINLAQKLVKRAFEAAEKVAYGKAKKVRFKTKSRGLHSIEEKTNKQGIMWKGDHVAWSGLILPMVKGAEKDLVIAHGLSSKVKYVRLVRRNIRGRERYYAQLICEGVPYQKPDRVIGNEDIGTDLGPSTVAIVGDTKASLHLLAEGTVRNHRKIRRLQRKQDRQRRANNPECYDELGRAIKGKHPTKKSRRQLATEAVLRDGYRREAAHRKIEHGQLTNEILAIGKYIHTEKLSFRAFQKLFGRSISVRAPKTFLSMLQRKAESAGGSFEEIPTRTTALSQTCICGRKHKKKLSERVHACDCGVVMQRDLFSAFLSKFVKKDRLHVADAYEHWQGLKSVLRTAWETAHNQLASRGLVPSSFGNPWSQSESSEKESLPTHKAQDDVEGEKSLTRACESAAV
jgi:transposase